MILTAINIIDVIEYDINHVEISALAGYFFRQSEYPLFGNLVRSIYAVIIIVHTIRS